MTDAQTAANAGPRLVASNSGLVVTNLGKRYRKRPVVRDVSLSVQRGEAVALLGPNGAGKTTSFYMIVGLVASDGGEIRISDDLENANLTHMPIHRRARMGLSYLPQEPSIFRRLSVQENIRAVLELGQRDSAQIEERLNLLLEDLNITHLRNAQAIALSGGERRRVEIARALATDPGFILLDEPFAGVDPIAVLDIQKIIGFLKARSKAISECSDIRHVVILADFRFFFDIVLKLSLPVCV